MPYSRKDVGEPIVPEGRFVIDPAAVLSAFVAAAVVLIGSDSASTLELLLAYVAVFITASAVMPYKMK